MLKKIKDWIGTNLDVYKVETANDVGAGLVRHIWKGEETATQVGTTLSAQVMNDLQKGLVHTLDTIRTVGTNKDIYEVALTGIEEFGVFDGLKLLIRIDGENQFEDVFLKLGGAEYQIYQLKNNMLDKIDKGILKDKKEYLLNFKSNSFVLSDSTLYGSQKGTALEGNRLAEILGLEFGGNIQDIGNKTKGKFYYDNVTKFYYECVEDNSLTYNDSGKFRAISNKPISDKVENLFEFGKSWITFPNGFTLMWQHYLVDVGGQFCKFPIGFLETPAVQISPVNGAIGNFQSYFDTPTTRGVKIFNNQKIWVEVLAIGKTK